MALAVKSEKILSENSWKGSKHYHYHYQYQTFPDPWGEATISHRENSNVFYFGGDFKGSENAWFEAPILTKIL